MAKNSLGDRLAVARRRQVDAKRMGLTVPDVARIHREFVTLTETITTDVARVESGDLPFDELKYPIPEFQREKVTEFFDAKMPITPVREFRYWCIRNDLDVALIFDDLGDRSEASILISSRN